MTFAERMPVYRDRVNLVLERWLPPPETYPERFHAALRYAVMGGGKRLRPLLSYATGEWLGIAPERIDGIAAAIEIIHAYALVHHDLPSMDDGMLRRGRPTTHVAFDEATAILVGDALQAHAYFVLASDENIQVAANIRRQLIVDLARCSGSGGMAGGQAMDMQMDAEGSPTLSDVERLYALKTGRLLQAAIHMPCRLLSPENPEIVAAADRFGRTLGLAFQIADDLLGLECSPQVMDKARGPDDHNDRLAIPSLVKLIGPEAARRRLGALRNDAAAALTRYGSQADGLRWLCDWVLDRPEAAARTV